MNEKQLECERRKRQQAKTDEEVTNLSKLNEEIKTENNQIFIQLRQRIQEQESSIARLTHERDSILSKSLKKYKE